ncbi:MAG: DUF3768 domain-containing protein, partial [Cyanobacteria bacterium]|nr:DUF3768 domain-containing protein [Cyanobacteriota bacterium]
MLDTSKTQRIAQLNDAFRSSMVGGTILLTQGINSLPETEQTVILEAVRTFTAFTKDNDPYGEHDFGAFEYNERRLFWKIDYYDQTLTYGSEDPSNPAQTTRVLTIMLA